MKAAGISPLPPPRMAAVLLERRVPNGDDASSLCSNYLEVVMRARRRCRLLTAGSRHAIGARALLALAMLAVPAAARAQDIEPRAFSNAPVGVNFLIGGYAFTRGGLSFDTAVPITNAHLNTSNAVLGYARVLDLWGNSAKFDAVLPVTWLSGTAQFAGQPVERTVDGLGDARFRLSVNFYGAPALTLKEFTEYQQDLILGASFAVMAPTGQYDPARVVNLGTNRWSFKPELGASKAIGPLALELTAGGNLLHRKHKIPPWQDVIAGPNHLNPRACDLQLFQGHLGLVRCHLFRRRPHQHRWRPQQ